MLWTNNNFKEKISDYKNKSFSDKKTFENNWEYILILI